MSDQYLRRSKVERFTGLSRSTFYRRVSEERFPAPFNVGANCVRWREQDLVEWKKSQCRALGPAANA